MEKEIYDIVIIGAGLSGLRTCDLLLKKNKDLKILILEANSRSGGRINTMEHEHKEYDIGGPWVGPKSDQMYVGDLLDEIGLKRHTYQAKGKKVMEFTSDSRKSYSILIPPIGILQAIEVQLTVWKLERLIASIPDLQTNNIPKGLEWDNMSADQWIEQNVRSENAKTLLRVAILSVFFEEPKNLSLLFSLLYFRSTGGIMKTVDDKGGAQQDRIIGGAYALIQYLYDSVNGKERVKLNHEVKSISNYDSYPVKITCANGETVLCKYVLSTIPPPLCKDIEYQPPLPEARNQLINSMKMGKVIKFFIFYEKAYWKLDGYCGETVSFRDSVSFIHDGTMPDGSNPCIFGFFAGDNAEFWGKQEKDARKEEAIDFVFKNLGNCQDKRYLSPVQYIECNWMQERFSQGGYCANISSKSNFLETKNALRDPIHNLFIAGTESATQWIGFMDGALESSERAATELLCKFK